MIFYMATKDKDCTSHYFDNKYDAIKYIWEEYRSRIEWDSNPNICKDMISLFENGEIEDIGWIETIHTEPASIE